MDLMLQSLLAKYKSEFSPESYPTTIPPRSTLTIGVNVRDPWVIYPYGIGGYSSNQSIPVSLLDANGVTKFSWTYFPDTFAWFEVLPVVRTTRFEEQGTHNSVVGNFFLDFENATYDNVDICFTLDAFLIDRALVDSFEEEFKEIYKTNFEIIQLLKEIKAPGVTPRIMPELGVKARIYSI